MSDLLTAIEAANHLKFSLDGFYRWRLRWGVRSAIPGRVLRFRLEDLERGQARAAQAATVISFPEAGAAHARGEFRRA